MRVPIQDQVETDLRAAIKARKDVEVRTLRTLKAALQSKELESGRGSLTPDAALAAIQKQAKQRKDSMEQFESAGRRDLFEREQEELAVIETYLPKALTDQELEEVVRNVLSETGASSPSDMGKVMGAVMPRVRGRADGNRVREIVSNQLKP